MRITKWLASILGHKALERTGSGIMESGIVHHEDENFTPVYIQKRRYPRFAIEGMHIQSKAIFSEPIQLLNISVGGVCIINKTPLKSGNSILVRMNRERVNRPILGTIIWNRQGSSVSSAERVNPPLYRSGIQFKNVNSGTLIQLKDFMRMSGIPEEKTYDNSYKPSTFRYTVIRNEEAILNYTVIYIVKKISLSGMLVEANRSLETGQKYPMALFLPNMTDPVIFHGRIASQIPIPAKESSYNLGIEFCDLAEHEKTKLKRFIAELLWKHQA